MSTENEENSQLRQELHKTQLKSTALVQRIADLTAEYENKVADLRVALTVMADAREEAVVQEKP